MGGLSNRKRGDEFSSLSNRQPNLHRSPDFHVSKRPRLFSSMQQSPGRAVSSNSAVSRISRYPEATSKLHREVHAPVRTSKFGSSSSVLGRGSSDKEEYSSDYMGNVLDKYKKAKASALRTLRYLTKKEVIDLVDEEPGKEIASPDSSIEEIDGFEDGRERSVVSGSRSKDEYQVAGNAQESMVSELSNWNVGMENAEKRLDRLSLNADGLEVLSKSAYQKLLEDAKRRDAKLGNLDFEIKLHEEKRLLFQELRPARKPDGRVPSEPFIPLTDEEEAEVERALSGNRRRVLVNHENSGIEITGETLLCLGPGAWLNDEVINLYLELLKEREKRDPQKFLKCHFFNTFFYKKLTSGRSGYDFKAVRRWTTQKKLGYSLIDCDKIFVPIHQEIHWCLAIINKKDEKFQYLDSLGGRDSRVLKVLARYIVDEVKDKCGKDIAVGSWDQEYVSDLPAQENGFDCGMFMIKYADFYSRGLGLYFDQDHMPYFRRRTAKEILRLRAD
ncbi:ubiquitin-like-specific protease ESD4 [Rhodamnia argentea]|uniref:Ubiquitin-like-specific protease ESD4 n=1 Tax=Rhodamnia argentea TaxID=178133 RepID=A0A8B8MPV6_9MYRT|nr:ubiquitin-like-specific protease ESD4 [Rhodamnia argentea]